MSGKKKAKRHVKILRARSAVSGRFISLTYAKRHPKTTVLEKR
jgi:hypothetical protein